MNETVFATGLPFLKSTSLQFYAKCSQIKFQVDYKYSQVFYNSIFILVKFDMLLDFAVNTHFTCGSRQQNVATPADQFLD